MQYKAQFKQATQRAGLPREFVFHGLRHTYASQLVAAGVMLEIVARQLGHSNTTTVSRFYGHLTEQFRKSEVRRNFSPLAPTLRELTATTREKLISIDEAFSAQHWREYVAIENQTSFPKRIRTIANAEVMDLFLDLEK